MNENSKGEGGNWGDVQEFYSRNTDLQIIFKDREDHGRDKGGVGGGTKQETINKV